jgi:hypothetical protein
MDRQTCRLAVNVPFLLVIGRKDALSVQRNVIQALVMHKAEMTNGAFPAG